MKFKIDQNLPSAISSALPGSRFLLQPSAFQSSPPGGRLGHSFTLPRRSKTTAR
jgi:hypothetical protein